MTSAQTMIQTIRAFGDFAHGGEDPALAAQEWLDAGFSADEAGAWLAARCFDADRAAELRDADVTPDQAERMIDRTVGTGDYEDTIGYKVANGDLSPSEARDL